MVNVRLVSARHPAVLVTEYITVWRPAPTTAGFSCPLLMPVPENTPPDGLARNVSAAAFDPQMGGMESIRGTGRSFTCASAELTEQTVSLTVTIYAPGLSARVVTAVLEIGEPFSCQL